MLRIATIALFSALLAAPAFAGHDWDRHDARLVKLARKLESATDRLERRAERWTRGHHRKQKRALRAIHRLEEQADEFRRVVNRRGARGKAVRRSYRELIHAYDVASRRFHRLDARPALYEDMDRVSRLMHKIETKADPIARRYAGRERFRRVRDHVDYDERRVHRHGPACEGRHDRARHRHSRHRS